MIEGLIWICIKVIIITIYSLIMLCILAEQVSYYLVRGYIRGKKITEWELQKIEREIMAQLNIKQTEDDKGLN